MKEENLILMPFSDRDYCFRKRKEEKHKQPFFTRREKKSLDFNMKI